MPIKANAVLTGIPAHLRDPLLVEYEKLLRNFSESRWEPAELDGGKLCEAIYSIIKGHMEGTFPTHLVKPRSMIDACRALENLQGTRSERLQIPRILVALYEIRNGRGVGHIGGDVDPNHMDAALVVAVAQWLMAELVRIFHGVSIEEATSTVDGLIERRIPLLWNVGGRTRILNSSMSFKDKMLVLLYGSNEPLKAKHVISSIEYSNPSVFRRTVIASAHKEALLDFDKKSDELRLSPLGSRYVEENICLTL